MVHIADRARDDTPHEDRIVVLSGASWADYQRLLEMRGDRSSPRIAYERGSLQIMRPSVHHEHIRSVLGALVETWCVERGIEANSVGSWTLDDAPADRAVEPDEAWQLGPLDPQRRPDLVIEVVWTTGGIQKLPMYAALGVGEVWIWRRGALAIHGLVGDGYEERATSAVFPGLDLGSLASFVDGRSTTIAIRDFRDAVRGT